MRPSKEAIDDADALASRALFRRKKDEAKISMTDLPVHRLICSLLGGLQRGLKGELQ